MENNTFPDRRGKSNPLLSLHTLFDRKSPFRGTADQRKGGYVDLCLILIVVLNVLDAFLTIIILGNGGSEVNLILRWALEIYGDKAWALKFALVSCGAIILCLHSHFRMVKVSIIAAAVLYIGVVMYQLVLLRFIFL